MSITELSNDSSQEKEIKRKWTERSHKLNDETMITSTSKSNRVPTRTGKPGKPGKMGRHFPVREKSGNFEQTGKVREKSGKITQNTGKLREFQTNIIFYFLVVFKLSVYYFAKMHQIFSYKINF